MPSRLSRLLVLCVPSVAACGGSEPSGPALLASPIAAELRTYGEFQNRVAPAPIAPAFVAYRGEGDAWVELAVDERIAFDIRHERYVLWVLCPEGEQSISRILHLAAEDTVAPTVRCPLDGAPDGAVALSVELGETENDDLAFAGGRWQTRYFNITGASVTVDFYAPEPTSFDLALLRTGVSTSGLRVERDVAIASGARFVVDIDAPFAEVTTAALQSPIRDRVDTVYSTGGGTRPHLLTSESSSVALVAESIRDDDDVYEIVTSADRLLHLSYRADPTTATSRAPYVFAPWQIALGDGELFIDDVTLGDAQFASFLVGTNRTFLEVEVTPSYLGPDRALSLVPPDAIAATVLPSADDPYDSSAHLYESNRAAAELLDVQLFESVPFVPRDKDGLDVRISISGTSGRLAVR